MTAADDVHVRTDDKARAITKTILLPWSMVVVATVLAQLVSLAFGRSNVEQSFGAIVLPSVLFLSALTLPLSGLGIALGRQIGLGTPFLTSMLYKQSCPCKNLQKDAGIAMAPGLVLGGGLLFLRTITEPYLPPELPDFGHRGVIGGLSVSFGAAVAEEVWFRLGLMTILIWCVSWSLGHREVRPVVAWTVITITSVGFGLVHLPQLMSYGAGSPVAIGGTIAGNSVVGMFYGWCYWRRSLEAAIIAHFAVDFVLHVLPAIVR